jgi:Tfp pilus assembly protein PilO
MIQMNELTEKIQKNFLNILVLGILIIVAYKIHVAQQKQIESIKAETQVELQKNEVLTQISQSEKRFKNLRRQFVNKDKDSFLPVLNTIAKDHQVKIIVVKPLPVDQKAPGYSRYSFSLNIAVDNYHTLGKFISALESHPFLFSVDGMSVNPAPEGEARRYKLNVGLDVSAILMKD